MSRKNRSRTQQGPKGRAPEGAEVTTAAAPSIDAEAPEPTAVPASPDAGDTLAEDTLAEGTIAEDAIAEGALAEDASTEGASAEGAASADDELRIEVTDVEVTDIELTDIELTDVEVTDVELTEGDAPQRGELSEADAEALGVVDDAAVARANAASYDHLKPIIEALIFASPEPLTPKTLFKLLESEPKEDVETALALLRQDYDHPGGLQLVEVAGGYQIVTRPELHEYVRRLFHERTSSKLSVQALETLAVIAYKQPITAPEITEIRGVNTSGVLNTLIDRKLVKIVGRKNVVGRPFMYATTRDFLDKFGLNDLTDLPKVEDLADVLGFEPPSLDANEPAAEMLAFDFGDPEESGSVASEPAAGASSPDAPPAESSGSPDAGSSEAASRTDDTGRAEDAGNAEEADSTDDAGHAAETAAADAADDVEVVGDAVEEHDHALAAAEDTELTNGNETHESVERASSAETSSFDEEIADAADAAHAAHALDRDGDVEPDDARDDERSTRVDNPADDAEFADAEAADTHAEHPVKTRHKESADEDEII